MVLKYYHTHQSTYLPCGHPIRTMIHPRQWESIVATLGRQRKEKDVIRTLSCGLPSVMLGNTASLYQGERGQYCSVCAPLLGSNSYMPKGGNDVNVSLLLSDDDSSLGDITRLRRHGTCQICHLTVSSKVGTQKQSHRQDY